MEEVSEWVCTQRVVLEELLLHSGSVDGPELRGRSILISQQ